MTGQDLLPDAHEPERLPTLRDIATPLFRHRKLLLRTFFGLVLATVLGIALLPKKYEAEMKILVKRERVDEAVSPGRDAALVNPGDVTEEELNSEVELIQSRDLLEKVVVSCGLQDPQPNRYLARLFPAVSARGVEDPREDRKDISTAVMTLEEKLHIDTLKKTNLIQVTYDSPDPQLAARVLSVLGELYLEKTVAVHRPPGAFEFFQSESQHYDKQLQDAQANLAKFDRDKGVSDPQLEMQNALQKLAEFESTLSATQVAIQETEKRIRTIQAQLPSTPQQTTSQVRTADNPYLLQQLKTTLLELQLKRTDLLTKFDPSYPAVQEVEKQIQQAQDAIASADKAPVRDQTTDRNPSYQWLQLELTQSTAELAGLRARAEATQEVIRQYRVKLGEIDANGTAQENLARDVKESEGNYLLYVQKREEARIGDALDRRRIMNVAIAEAATAPALPLHPHWILTLLMGIVLAALISPGVAFAADYLDPSIRTPDDVWHALQIPVLASLPKSKGESHVS